MKPIRALLLFGLLGLPESILIAWILSLVGVPAWGQLAAFLVGEWACMFAGVLCLAAKMGETTNE